MGKDNQQAPPPPSEVVGRGLTDTFETNSQGNISRRTEFETKLFVDGSLVFDRDSSIDNLVAQIARANQLDSVYNSLFSPKDKSDEARRKRWGIRQAKEKVNTAILEHVWLDENQEKIPQPWQNSENIIGDLTRLAELNESSNESGKNEIVLSDTLTDTLCSHPNIDVISTLATNVKLNEEQIEQLVARADNPRRMLNLIATLGPAQNEMWGGDEKINSKKIKSAIEKGVAKSKNHPSLDPKEVPGFKKILAGLDGDEKLAIETYIENIPTNEIPSAYWPDTLEEEVQSAKDQSRLTSLRRQLKKMISGKREKAKE